MSNKDIANVGGIVGHTVGASTLENCYAAGYLRAAER